MSSTRHAGDVILVTKCGDAKECIWRIIDGDNDRGEVRWRKASFREIRDECNLCGLRGKERGIERGEGVTKVCEFNEAT
jgi:hypothetical protein